MNKEDVNQIVVSSRVRLARNIENFNFPCCLSKEKGEELRELVYKASLKVGNFNFYNLKNMQECDILRFVENGYISSDLIKMKEIAGLLLSPDETVSIMINEEDHIREQCVLSGLNLKKAYDIINDIDYDLGKNLKFSYSKDLGFLTACPSNLGTGMRASAMLFLPALCKSGNITNVINTVSKLGICVRGSSGEGTKASANLFQVSNQNTLGKSEKDIIQLVESTVLKICELEIQAREVLLKDNEVGLKDEVLRAFGIISNCYKISMQEFYDLIAKIKLGIDLKLIYIKCDEDIFNLINMVKPYNLMQKENKNLNNYECEIVRAKLLNSYFKNTRV